MSDKFCSRCGCPHGPKSKRCLSCGCSRFDESPGTAHQSYRRKVQSIVGTVPDDVKLGGYPRLCICGNMFVATNAKDFVCGACHKQLDPPSLTDGSTL